MGDSTYFVTEREYCYAHKFIFPVVQALSGINDAILSQINPQKQRTVAKLMQNTELRSLCDNVTVFGSAVDTRCRYGSDIDLAVTLFEDTLRNGNRATEIIGELCDWNYDAFIMNHADIHSELYKIIHRKGVRII